jgi:hypothetical protein
VRHDGSLACAGLVTGALCCLLSVACGGVAAPAPADAPDASQSPTDGSAGLGASPPGPPADSGPGGDTSSSVADAAADAAVPGAFPAPHAPLPQVPDQGGPILASPHLITITYPGFVADPDVNAFGSFVVTSSWLTTAGAEYGVGAGSHTHVVLTDPAPASLAVADVASYLSQKIADGTLPGGVQTQPGNDLYMIFYPPSTSITDMNTTAQCNSTAGTTYKVGALDHDGTGAGQRFAYAIVSTCPDEPTLGIVWTAAEVFMTAATDPYRLSDPAYLLPAANPWFPWENQVGYMCNFMPPVIEGGYSLPPVWSNARAASGSWPCVPAQAGPYFNVSVSPNVTQTIAAGSSITIPVTGWSTAAVPDWTVTANPSGTAFTPTASFAGSASTNGMNNAATTMLTIGVPAGTPSQSLGAVRLHSARNNGDWLSEWVVPVQVQ